MAIKLTKELLTEKAEAIVKEAVNEKKVTSTQMRKFYDDLLILHSKSKIKNEEEFKSEILPLIWFTKAKLAYNVGRNVLPLSFKKNIDSYINLIESKKDFDNFILFYQAIIGYTKFSENTTKNSDNNYKNNNKFDKNNYNKRRY